MPSSDPRPSVTPPMSKADYVYGVLAEEIRSARIPGGTALRAAAIARRLGVSVTPVREALRRLEKDRLISYEAHHGATVVDLGDDALEEFYGLRAVVEGLGARLAATRITPEELGWLRELHAAMARDAAGGRLDRLGEQSRHFHLRIADIGGPAFLGQHARAVHDSFPVPATASLWLDPGQVPHQLEAHEGILDALERGDGADAERLMIEHVRRAGDHRRDHPPTG
ncbi:GntR family transcriptional regulator [Nonomuraea roseoviolacea subsp. roseoviolacea]|uniref:DNA-binding GntR family transcriptional regulator n=1 Tax=Nonomuraea roseoviolacea subsp. carminata TaxID=160689 RepID=A0ABT1KF24_9ACTN|nr:GntR family transcriptional regulator [Nonomuraea roseoviolacea]MCP2352257.1 DNA-binding GntR family transcriptional regulator [Nonomuraea roseoviolacea subsp. carminata]